MKRIVLSLTLLMVIAMAFAQKPKYVFYFIGDGMGVNQVNGTEMYMAQKDGGRIGLTKLLFGTFPVASMATTYSVTNSITDSAAGGTALATGVKTYNSAMGVDRDTVPVTSIAEMAKKAGYKVGVTTSVSVDHATPASFYAHQAKRNYYYEIATDLPKSGFDFFGGSGFLRPDKSKDGNDMPNIFPIFEQAGYTVARGVDEYKSKKDGSDKMILIQKEDKVQSSLPYAIDRQSDDLTLADITESAIDYLTKDKKSKGFFLMVEGGKIDWACHSNDGATTFQEVVDMDEAVKVAYEFYQKHPKETLIVITADHETGGLGLGNTDYTLHLDLLENQKMSVDELSRKVTDLRKSGEPVTWEQVKSLLTETMGFFTKVQLTWEQERKLHDAFNETFVHNNVKFSETLYSRTEELADVAKDVINDASHLGWTTGAHSAGFVPVFAIGAGSNNFVRGTMENIDIPMIIATTAGYKK